MVAQSHLARKYGRWAVVTGASDGIGRATAIALAESGLDVVLVARRRERLQDVANDLHPARSSRIIDADLATDAGIERVLRETNELDVGLLVAAAGFGTSGDFVDGDLDAELSMLAVNCRATLVMARRYGERFVDRGRGGMVLMSSLLAFQGVPRAAHYAATKAYVQSLAEGLRLELGPRGVDVIASAPGPVRSGFAARANMVMGGAVTPEVVARGTLAALGGAGTVRPGLLSKFLEASLSTLPRTLRTRAVGLVMKGMTKHQHALAAARRPRSA